MFCFIICPNASPGLVISYAANSESGNLEAHHCNTVIQQCGIIQVIPRYKAQSMETPPLDGGNIVSYRSCSTRQQKKIAQVSLGTSAAGYLILDSLRVTLQHVYVVGRRQRSYNSASAMSNGVATLGAVKTRDSNSPIVIKNNNDDPASMSYLQKYFIFQKGYVFTKFSVKAHGFQYFV